MIGSAHRCVIGSGRSIHLGISTCPNDTFAFAGLLEGLVDPGGFQWTIDLLDISQLNAGLFAGDFDVAKTSFHAAMQLADVTQVLPVGSALGFGVGPLLLAARAGDEPTMSNQITLCPGAATTATFLFNAFYPNTTHIDHVLFSEIMPRLSSQSADFGVCIHEGRFTYAQSGLHLVSDLGEQWESETNSPLPLGGLVIRDHHDASTVRRVIDVVDASLALARDRNEIALPVMRRFAQEFDDTVLMQHVDLYVNEWTFDLGEVGRTALEALSEYAERNPPHVSDRTSRCRPCQRLRILSR